MPTRLAVMARGPGRQDSPGVTYSEDPDEPTPKDPTPNEPRAASVTDEVRRSLLRSRTVLIFGEIDSELAQATTAQLLALARATRRSASWCTRPADTSSRATRSTTSSASSARRCG